MKVIEVKELGATRSTFKISLFLILGKIFHHAVTVSYCAMEWQWYLLEGGWEKHARHMGGASIMTKVTDAIYSADTRHHRRM